MVDRGSGEGGPHTTGMQNANGADGIKSGVDAHLRPHVWALPKVSDVFLSCLRLALHAMEA